MTGSRLVKVGATAVVVLLAAGAGAAVFAMSRTGESTGRCVDELGDTYEFEDNGMFRPSGQLKSPDEYSSWTIPVSPPDGSDIVSAELVRDSDWLTVTVELADRWVPAPQLDDPNADWENKAGLQSTVSVSVEGRSWRGFVFIVDSAGPTEFAVRSADEPVRDPEKTVQLDRPRFDGPRATVRIPADEIERFGESFEFSLSSTKVTSGDAVVIDDCPGDDQAVRFPNATPRKAESRSLSKAASAPALEAAESSSTTAVTPADPTHVDPNLEPEALTGEASSQEEVAKALLDAWNENDPGSAAALALDEAVRFMFSEPTEGDAELVRCRHYSEIPEGEYQAFSTFVCDGTFSFDGLGVQTVELYVDGGSSAGYEVSAVSFNRNPPGWRPVD